jgi:hypothetical protein
MTGNSGSFPVAMNVSRRFEFVAFRSSLYLDVLLPCAKYQSSAMAVSSAVAHPTVFAVGESITTLLVRIP